MALRNYNNTTVAGALTVPTSPSDVYMSVSGFAGYPTPPFTATVERSLPTEEVVFVTAVNANTLTVVRGYNGTAAQTHLAGASVEHTAVALDFSEANSHVNASANIHGIVGGLVGDEAAQTLLDKTLISPVFEADVAAGDAIVAYVPEGAESRNLFRGMDPNGDDVALIDSTGDATFAGVHSTGSAQVDGNLTVATAAVTGNVTVAGTLDVTGALASGAIAAPSVTTTGPTKGGGLESTAGLVIAQLGADPADAGASKAAIYGRGDGGLYFEPTAQSRRRSTMHWGSGSTLPTTGVMDGDSFRHTGLGCTLLYTGTVWRQIETPAVATVAARNTISTTYASALYAGFQVHVLDLNFLFEWDGTAWRFARGYGDPNNATRERFHLGLSATNQNVAHNTTLTLAWNLVSSPLVTYNGTARNFTIQHRGIYNISGYFNSDSNAAGSSACQVNVPAHGVSVNEFRSTLTRGSGYPGAGLLTQGVATGPIYMDAGQTFHFTAFHYSTSSSTVPYDAYFNVSVVG